MYLMNEDEQYSVWFAWKAIPKGWKKVGLQDNQRRRIELY
jgi:uncharacterized protein YbdZ (MbtH family)